MTIIKNVPFDLANTRVDKAASELFPDFSRTQIKKWILDGRILVNGDLSKPKENVQENDEIEINPIEEKKVSWEAQNINFDVHYEADDFIEEDAFYEIVTSPSSLHAVVDKMKENNIDSINAELTMRPETSVLIDEEMSEKVIKLMNHMDDLDDVQEVHTNAEFPANFEMQE